MTMQYELRHDYPSVETRSGMTYGGTQRLGRLVHMRKWGCGVIAACDLLFYLDRYHPEYKISLFRDAPGSGVLDLNWYNDKIDYLRRHFLPVIPFHGINGFGLAWGVNGILRRNGLKLRTRWGIRPSKLWSRIDHLLSLDIPVIFSIGGNFPRMWAKEKLNLYAVPDRSAKPAARTTAHYVMITGSDDEWLRISSWGRQYYISKLEYCRYVEQHSNGLLSSILDIRHLSS